MKPYTQVAGELFCCFANVQDLLPHIAVFAVVLARAFAQSQPPEPARLTLSDAVKLALKQNPQHVIAAIRVTIDDNTRVNEGDALVRIDPQDSQAVVDQATAALALATAEAESAKLKAGLTRETTLHETSGAIAQQDADGATLARSRAQLEQAATATLLQVKANVEARRATYERAPSDLSRYKPLVATQDVSKFQYDAAEAWARVAKSSWTPPNSKWPRRSKPWISPKPERIRRKPSYPVRNPSSSRRARGSSRSQSPKWRISRPSPISSMQRLFSKLPNSTSVTARLPLPSAAK